MSGLHLALLHLRSRHPRRFNPRRLLRRLLRRMFLRHLRRPLFPRRPAVLIGELNVPVPSLKTRYLRSQTGVGIRRRRPALQRLLVSAAWDGILLP